VLPWLVLAEMISYVVIREHITKQGLVIA
jgi:hypothetical protein